MKKMMIAMTAVASALVLLFPGVAAGDHPPVRTEIRHFEFFAIGQGDIGVLCLNHPEPTDPPELAAFQSCARVTPQEGEHWVGINVVDSEGNPVYFTAQQANNPGFAGGCGIIEWGSVVESHPGPDPLDPPTVGGPLVWAINDSGPGNSTAEDVLVFPWAGPGVNNVLDQDGAPCQGSTDTNIIQPGEEGTVTFEFHENLLP